MPFHCCRTPLASLLALTLAATFLSDVRAWTTGRATYYDDNKEGACRYGTNIPAYYAAWPDGQDGAPACGECYEVQCVDRNFRDGFGETCKRDGACYDENESVIVKIVDSCPCVHSNYYSNQRWCCSDSPHIDLGRDAFKKLAGEHHGVIGAKWRQVECPSSMKTSKYYSSKSDDSSDYSSYDYKEEKPKKKSKKSSSSSSSKSSSRSGSFRSSSWSSFSWFGKK